jgi:hypothetical protein
VFESLGDRVSGRDTSHNAGRLACGSRCGRRVVRVLYMYSEGRREAHTFSLVSLDMRWVCGSAAASKWREGQHCLPT